MNEKRLRFPGFAERLRDRLLAEGYGRPDGTPDVPRFCEERRYRLQDVYAWLADRLPQYENLRRLAKDLRTPVAWLLLGEEGIFEIRQAEMFRAPKSVKKDRRSLGVASLGPDMQGGDGQ